MTGEAQWPIGPRDGRPGNRHPSPSDTADNWSTSRDDGRSRKTAGSGRVSVALAHLSKRRRAARRGHAIADLPPDAEYGRPQARRRMRPDDRPTSQCSFLFPIEQTEVAAFALPGRCSGITRVISARR